MWHLMLILSKMLLTFLYYKVITVQTIKQSTVLSLLGSLLISSQALALEITEEQTETPAPVSIEEQTNAPIPVANKQITVTSNTGPAAVKTETPVVKEKAIVENEAPKQEATNKKVKNIVYVSDESGIWTTRGPGRQYRLSGTVKVGEKLQIIDEKANYYEVLTESGKEVWIPKKETQTHESNRAKVQTLLAENDQLKYRLNNFDSETAKELKVTSAELIALKKEHSELLKNYTSQNEEVKRLTETNARLEIESGNKERTNQITWFTYGGIIAGIGIIIGAILVYLPRPRRRSNNDYYY